MKNKYLLIMLIFTFNYSEKSQANLESGVMNRGGGIATVGNDNACDFRIGNTRIQDALDDFNDYTELRLADNTTYTENIVITDRTITIRGGFANCTDAANNIQTSSARTVISGELNSKATVTIRTIDETVVSLVTLENLEITEGGGLEGEQEVGGIGASDANLVLSLERVDIKQNDVTNQVSAGGINVFNNNPNSSSGVLMNDVKILNNTGSQGGGIHCSGQNNSITIEGISSIAFNEAQNGAGLFLDNGCTLNMYSGQEVGNVGTLFDGVTLNEASEDGGGLYVSGGAKAHFLGSKVCVNSVSGQCLIYAGSNSTVANISSNTAGNNGGGVFITDNGSEVIVDTGALVANTAMSNGGGVYAKDGAHFVMQWQDDDAFEIQRNCALQGKCSLINGNSAETFGGAVIAVTGAKAEIYRTVIEKNNAASGSVAYVSGEDTVLQIDGAVIIDNGSSDGSDNFLFRTFNGVNSTIGLQIRNTTIADNRFFEELFGNQNSAINIQGSIISEPGVSNLYESLGGNATFICVVVNEAGSLSGANFTQQIVEEDPQFIDRANGDYHLNAAVSPAVDLCSISDNSLDFDIDLELRGFDDPLTSNVNGVYDAGADETYSSDIIFKDGFE